MLLDGEGRAESTLERLGLGVVTELAVVAIQATDTGALPRLLDLVLIHLDAYHRSAVAAIAAERLYVLVAVEGARSRDGLVRTLQDWLARAGRTVDAELRVGVGQTLPGAGGIADSRRGADRALALSAGAGGVVTLEDVHAGALLASHPNTLRYRVRRIIELTGADLSDPQARLALEVQLRALP